MDLGFPEFPSVLTKANAKILSKLFFILTVLRVLTSKLTKTEKVSKSRVNDIII